MRLAGSRHAALVSLRCRWVRSRFVWQHTRMDSLTRIATATLAVLFATTTTPPGATAAESRPVSGAAPAEIQIGLCAPAEEIVRALDLRPRAAAIEVWQFDDETLTLYRRGLRLRLRVTPDGRSVLTLKVADRDCAQLDPKRVPRGEGKCEYDVYGTTIVGAVSLNVTLDEDKTNELIAGRATPADVLSAAQTRYLREVVGMWPLPPEIRKLGPMSVQTYRTRGSRYDIDVSELPGGERFAEISRKAPLDDASRTMAAMKTELSRAGIAMCADQSSQAANKLRALLK